MPVVRNRNAGEYQDAVYVGRPSIYGNKFHITDTQTRLVALEKYGSWIHGQTALLDTVRTELRGKDLLCSCAPKACHADILLRIANAPDVVSSFSGDYEFLSNFYPAPVLVKSVVGRRVSETLYPTAEHVYQAYKTLDPQKRLWIADLPTAGQAKRAGARLALRPRWYELRLRVMESVLRLKFEQHPYLKQLLMDSRFATLVEGNYWNDTFWGVCRGVGFNHLGLLLMKLRQHFNSTVKET